MTYRTYTLYGPTRGAEVIFSAPKPRARGALGGFSTSEIAIAVLKLCPGDPCVRARHAAAATCAETQQQRLRRRPPRAPPLPACTGVSGRARMPLLLARGRAVRPWRGSFVGAEVERRQPKPRRALRGVLLHPVHFFCACHLPAGPETAAKPVRRRSPRLLPPGCLLQVCIHGHKMELSRELQWRVSTGIGRERCTHLGYTPYCHSP